VQKLAQDGRAAWLRSDFVVEYLNYLEEILVVVFDEGLHTSRAAAGEHMWGERIVVEATRCQTPFPVAALHCLYLRPRWL
jgi:hypothetical protein